MCATSNDRLDWFRRDRFGMMIHWGLYTLLGEGTWAMHHRHMPHTDYAKLAEQFDPREFSADEWARTARSTGMRYMVFTTRHHDGYCMYDSKVSDFTSVQRGPGRDFVREYVDACRRHNLKVGLYYSLLDWRFPGYFEPEKYPESAEAMVQQAHDQLRELLSNYGKIDLLWFDGHWMHRKWAEWRWEDPQQLIDFWRADQLETMIRELQPEIIFNDRMAVEGDYQSVEQSVNAVEPHRDAWEAAQTIGDFWESWCDQRYTANPSRKSAAQLIIQLAVVAGRDGNLLLNVGPRHDGQLQRADLALLDEIGRWLLRNGEAIYGTAAAPIPVFCSCGLVSTKGNYAYVLLPCWPKNQLVVTGVGTSVTHAEFLCSGDSVTFDQDEAGRVVLKGLPRIPPDPYVTVIRLSLESSLLPVELEDEGAWVLE